MRLVLYLSLSELEERKGYALEPIKVVGGLQNKLVLQPSIHHNKTKCVAGLYHLLSRCSNATTRYLATNKSVCVQAAGAMYRRIIEVWCTGLCLLT